MSPLEACPIPSRSSSGRGGTNVAGPAVGKPAETDTYYTSGGARIEVDPTPAGRGDEPRDLGTIVLGTRTHNE